MDSVARRLAKATAARCRRKTLVLSRDGSGLARAIRDRGLEVVVIDDPSEASDSAAFPTVVVSDALEHVGRDDVPAVLSTAWSLVSPGGRLIVNVPNEEGHFDRRRLKRSLRAFGEPRLGTDQPYRFITMLVEKPGSRPSIRREWRERFRSIAKRCRGRVVELGCGRGELANVIHAAGHEVLGVDTNTKKIGIARETYPAIEFVESDIQTVELPDASFETAVLAEVLEHVSEVVEDGMLSKAWRLLRPGGRLIVSVPNEDCIPHRNHIRGFDRRSLARLLESYGHPELCTDQPFKWLLMYVDKSL